MSRAQLTSTVEQNSAGAAAPYVAAKNALANGGFDIWQRGTSISLAASTSAANGYTADRWDILNGANQAMTISRQATGDTTNLPFIQYAARVQRNSGQTGTGTIYMRQGVETANSIPLAGKTVTFSFYARAGANYSATSNYITFTVGTGTGTDQNPMSFTGEATPINNNTTVLTTTWQRFTGTGTLSSSATEIYVGFAYTPTGTASTNDYFEITGVQIEQGSVATPFSRAGGTVQGELTLCQRYYYRVIPTDSYGILCPIGFTTSTTNAQINYQLPITMRVEPNTIDYSTLRLIDMANGSSASITAVYTTNQGGINLISFNATSSSLTANHTCYVQANNSTSAYIGFSAEL